MSNETEDVIMSVSNNSTAYIITTFAIISSLIAFYFMKIYQPKPEEEEEPEEEEYIPLDPRDFTLEELKEFDGQEGRPVCIGVNGKVYDVTKGRGFYGPGGPYAALAGHDGSRALATMSMDESAITAEWDDLSDLTPFQQDALNDWVMTFQTKYSEIGKLIKSRDE